MVTVVYSSIYLIHDHAIPTEKLPFPFPGRFCTRGRGEMDCMASKVPTPTAGKDARADFA